MLEDRKHNALAALDIFQNVLRADAQMTISPAHEAEKLNGRGFTSAEMAKARDLARTGYANPHDLLAAVRKAMTSRDDAIVLDPAEIERMRRKGMLTDEEAKAELAKATGRSDAAPGNACTFILVDGAVDQVVQHTGNWKAIVEREVRDLKKMDCGKVTTKEYANETAGYAKHDSVREDSVHAKMFRVEIEQRDNGAKATRTFMALDPERARALAATSSNVAKVLSVSEA